MSEMILREMAEGLAQVNDLSWGMYAFSRDILRDKISEAEKKRMIELAICCGYEMADKVMSSLGTWDPWELAEKFKLKVEYADRGQIADRVLFALFTPPDQIQIMISVVTVVGLQFGYLLGGSVVTEAVFAYPGLGSLLIESVNYRDYPAIQSLILIFSLQFIIINLVVDILYAILNPEIKLG